MRPVLTPAEMAAADRAALDAGTPVEVLMDRAGRAVAWAVRHLLGGTYGRRGLVVCGRGNNGGDGRVAARVLASWGLGVRCVDLDAFEPDAFTAALERADVLVDAMFGTGMRGELTGAAATVAAATHVAARRPGGPVVVAVDIPSGVDGTTGEVRGPAVRADCTVTFAAPKPGLCLEPGRRHAGRVRVADIGIPVAIDDTVVGALSGSPNGTEAPDRPDARPDGDARPGAARMGVLDDADLAALVPARPVDAHKWSAGGVLVVGGSAGMTGAPMLAGRAALRAGAGIVHVGLPGAEAATAAGGTEIITVGLPEEPGGSLAPDAADAVVAAAPRFRALALGPGLGRRADTATAVRRIVGEVPVPLVIDADALAALGGHLGLLAARAATGRSAVLTPHDGEFTRLTGAAPGTDRVEAARRLAAVTGAVVLLKGPTPVIAAPGGAVLLETAATPVLATAGSGDVLTGIVAAFCARGASPFAAAAAAARTQSLAGRAAGHTGVVAGDLVTALPGVLAATTAPVPVAGLDPEPFHEER